MPKAGPYYLYMIDFKRSEEQRLNRTLNMAEVSQMASDSWNSMSDKDKAFYKDKAKDGTVKIPRRPSGAAGGSDGNVRQGLMTSQGVPVAVIEREQQEKENEIKNMRRRIDYMLRKNPFPKDFAKFPLYFMYGNYFYKNRQDKFSPAEIAIIKFNFADGILGRYHTLINPEEKPEMGFAYTAKAHSEESHRLPPPPNAHGERNLSRVLQDIRKFMKDYRAFDDGNPIVFTYTSQYSTESDQIDVLKSFMKQFGDQDDFQLDFFPLTRLFYKLRKELATNDRQFDIPSENFVHAFLSYDKYESIGGISCEFHEQMDATRFCALSRVCRWTFVLADHFSSALGVQLVHGDRDRVLKELDISTLSLEPKSEDRVMRSSQSTLNYDVQSVQTASSASASALVRGKVRASRASLVRSHLRQSDAQSTVTSSTFYESH